MQDYTILVRAAKQDTDTKYPWISYFEDVTEEQADKLIASSSNFINIEYKKILSSSLPEFNTANHRVCQMTDTKSTGTTVP